MPFKEADSSLKSSIKLPVTLSGEGSAEFLSIIRREFHLKNVRSVEIIDQAFEGGKTLLFLRFTSDAILRGADLGVADGVAVEVGGTLTLRFGSNGELLDYEMEEPRDEDLETARKEFVTMVRAGMVHLAGRNEAVNFQRLSDEGKTMYIQEDGMGIRRPHRIIVD